MTDATSQSQRVRADDEVFYGSGAAANAAKIAGYFGVTAAPLALLPAGHVEVLLGTESTLVPGVLAPAASPAATPSASSTAGDNGAAAPQSA